MEHLFDCLKGMPCCKSCARISSGEMRLEVEVGAAEGVDEKGSEAEGGATEGMEDAGAEARAGMEGSVARLHS